MTDPNYTALLQIVDRSGSMATIRDEMVGALSSMVTKQAAEPGLLTVDFFQFDHEIEQLTSLAPARDVQITLDPRGATALYDAVGFAVSTFGATLAALPEHTRPGAVQVVIVTDGEENSSQEWTAASVQKLVTTQSAKYDWDFVYLGANQDAVLTGAALGIAADASLTYRAGAAGVIGATASIARYMTERRGGTRRGFCDGERSAARDE